MTDLDDILRKLKSMDETLTEIHRIVMDLHEQWNKPSDMTDAIEEAMKGAHIRLSSRPEGPEDV